MNKSASGYILFNEKTGEFWYDSFTKNRHDTWQRGELFNSRATLKREGWRCVACVVALRPVEEKKL